MVQSDIQSFTNGFVAALQLPAPDARLAAIRERTEKGLRLGVAIEQPPSDSKPVDITFAALGYVEELTRMRWVYEEGTLFCGRVVSRSDSSHLQEVARDGIRAGSATEGVR